MGPFMSSYNNKYILLAVDYASKWVEAIETQTNYTKGVLNFLRKNIFARLRTPRAIISDEGTHFCNKLFDALLLKYGDKHRIALAYHPQTNGKAEIYNQEVQKIMEKIVNSSRKDWARKWMMLYGHNGRLLIH